MVPPLTLVLGGAASGKSAFAERCIENSGLQSIYVATAQAWDAEMGVRISQHRARRGPDWTTREAPLDLVSLLSEASPTEALLIDCLTLWLTNVMLAEADVETACDGLLAALAARRSPVTCVSNEVGQGIVPESALGRRFRDAQGRLNQRVAAAADRVILVTAGLPLALKGPAPA